MKIKIVVTQIKDTYKGENRREWLEENGYKIDDDIEYGYKFLSVEFDMFIGEEIFESGILYTIEGKYYNLDENCITYNCIEK